MVVTIDVQHIYKFPVELVGNTHFTKYPSDKEKFVKKIEVAEEKTDPVKGVNYRRAIAYCENVIPRLLRSFQVLNEGAILLEEESWYDKQQKVLLVKSQNLTWSKYAKMWEKSTFRPYDKNPNWTVFEQHGCIDICGIGPFGRVLELFAERFLHSGVKRSLSIMEGLLMERYGDVIKGSS